jgi:hypothetical protein
MFVFGYGKDNMIYWPNGKNNPISGRQKYSDLEKIA